MLFFMIEIEKTDAIFDRRQVLRWQWQIFVDVCSIIYCHFVLLIMPVLLGAQRIFIEIENIQFKIPLRAQRYILRFIPAKVIVRFGQQNRYFKQALQYIPYLIRGEPNVIFPPFVNNFIERYRIVVAIGLYL